MKNGVRELRVNGFWTQRIRVIEFGLNLVMLRPSRLHSTYYADLIQTVPILLGLTDYNDYYRNTYSKFGFTHRIKTAILGRRLDLRLLLLNGKS